MLTERVRFNVRVAEELRQRARLASTLTGMTIDSMAEDAFRMYFKVKEVGMAARQQKVLDAIRNKRLIPKDGRVQMNPMIDADLRKRVRVSSALNDITIDLIAEDALRLYFKVPEPETEARQKKVLDAVKDMRL